jgi:hypothetical protein
MVVNENEIATLLLCLGVFIFTLKNRGEFKQIPSSGVILTGFYLFFGGVILTVAEEFIWPDLLNYIEHLLYLFSSVMVFIWCWLVFAFEKRIE